MAISDVMGLLHQGKRTYNLETKEVKREEFEAQALIHSLIFGELGLADTLGPTWEMIHDPRFIAIENSFVRFRQGRLGGDASTGQSKQMPDGSFSTSVEDLNQYSEILGEGRYLHGVLQSMAYFRGALELWPKHNFAIPADCVEPGLYIVRHLNEPDRGKLLSQAALYDEFRPHLLFQQSDDFIWDLIRQECPNYLNPRTGKFNQAAQQLFTMLRLDLVGLIDDYAEVAKLQEWVLLDDEFTLVEDKHIEANSPRVWAEVEMLERALTLRASLRVTAAAVLDSIGASHLFRTMEVTLTDLERDELLQIVYGSQYPDDQPQLMNDIIEYLAAIRASSTTTEAREAAQCAAASQRAKKYVAKLMSGEILPISRVTDPGADLVLSEEQRIADEILHNPIKQMLFLRWTGAEEAANNAASVEEALPYCQIADLLAPVFQSADYVVTEESAHELLMQAEALVPTRRLPLVELSAEDAASRSLGAQHESA